MEKATFAAGCFWGVEEAFRKVKGIRSTKVGYTGGNFKNPTYKDVCAGKTGHAEAVEVLYDPSTITYKELLEMFWNLHDPTTLNRQGPDIGTQYRSTIFFHDSDQEEDAKTSLQQLQSTAKYRNQIVTEIKPVLKFFRAEEYHQKYLFKRRTASCN